MTTTTSARPNFVFIMTDTQGANVVGCYGHQPGLGTPNLDRLAAGGVRFERAYTACPICTPARGAIFSGIMPHTNGAWANSLPYWDNVRSAGQRFRDAGYHTAFTGKWHLSGLDYFDSGICPDGWDERYWYDGKRYLNDLTPEQIALWRTGLPNAQALREHAITAEFTWGRRISDRGIAFLQEAAREDKPFLLCLSYDEPHGPETCPADYVDRFKDFAFEVGPAAFDDLTNKPSAQKRMAQFQGEHHADAKARYPRYFGCNSFVDDEIGRVLEAVDRFAPPNTYVIFTSDHGSMFGAHGLCGKGATMYEETCRIPMMMRGPGVASGKVDPTLVGHVDILPTMLQLAGLDVPPILDGKSLVRNLQDPAYVDHDAAVFIEYHRGEVQHDATQAPFYLQRCIRKGDWKFTLNLLDDLDELYNLKQDPHELTNLVHDAASAAVRDQLYHELVTWMYERQDPFRTPQLDARAWYQGPPIEYRNHRVRPADGYLPPYLNYDTCRSKDGQVNPAK